MDLYDKTVEFVDSAFGAKSAHFERAVYWIERFYPNYSLAHRIAAYSHDIERGVAGEKDRDYLNPEILKRHQEKGAEIMAEFLKKQGADQELVEKVKHLISRHEWGGDEEQNALMDADSVSYFETNAEMFVKKRAPKEGYEKIKAKLDWMFERISSPKAKEAARDNYEKWAGELDSMSKSGLISA